MIAETILIYLHSQFRIKESLSLVRIPETLVMSMEYINIHTPAEHMEAIDVRQMTQRVSKSNSES